MNINVDLKRLKNVIRENLTTVLENDPGQVRNSENATRSFGDVVELVPAEEANEYKKRLEQQIRISEELERRVGSLMKNEEEKRNKLQAQIDDLKSQNDKRQSKTKELEEAISVLELLLKSSDVQIAKLSRLEKETEEQKTLLSNKLREIENLQDDIEKLRSETESGEVREAALLVKVRSLDAQILSGKTENEVLINRNKELETLFTDLEKNYRTLEAELAKILEEKKERERMEEERRRQEAVARESQWGRSPFGDDYLEHRRNRPVANVVNRGGMSEQTRRGIDTANERKGEIKSEEELTKSDVDYESYEKQMRDEAEKAEQRKIDRELELLREEEREKDRLAEIKRVNKLKSDEDKMIKTYNDRDKYEANQVEEAEELDESDGEIRYIVEQITKEAEKRKEFEKQAIESKQREQSEKKKFV